MVCTPPNTGELEELFRYEVFKMLKAEGKITDVVIENMMNWRHSGFSVYCGKAIWPDNEQGLENLARYIIRASFSQERMTYVAGQDSSDGIAKIDNNTRFRYLLGYWCLLIDASMCGAVADPGTQLSVFDSSALKKQYLCILPISASVENGLLKLAISFDVHSEPAAEETI